MNVVIYARYSSHSQTVQSIEGQLKVCKEYAERNNMTVIGEYIEEAITGTTDNRPMFKKMIKDSTRKVFSGVLVYQFDRFARNRYDFAEYKKELKKNNVRVYSAREHISDDASGILVEGLLESMAEYYSAELSQKIRRGMDINASKGKGTGGNIALGYKLDSEKKFTIDEQGAEIVRLVFEMYANNNTIVQICEYLNQKGYKTSKGSKFNKNSLRLMLRNKRYIGIYTYKGEETSAIMPRIVSDELFNEVQEKLAKNKKAPARKKAKVDYLLTTKLFCGCCKNMMTGESGTSKTKKVYQYYKCVQSRKKLCNKKPIQKSYIEDLVVNQCRLLLTNDNIDKIVKEVIAINQSEELTSTINRLRKLLKGAEKRKRNMIVAISECSIDKVRQSIYQHLEEIENEIENLELQIAQEKLQIVEISENEVRFFLHQLKNGNINEEKYRSMLVNIFVNSIYLYENKITLIFNSTGQTVKVEKSLIEEIEELEREDESSHLGKVAPP